MRTAILASCLLITTAAIADGQQQAPAARPMQQATATPDKDKKICRTMYHQGTIIRTQQCKTQAEWDRNRLDAQRSVADFQNRNYQTSNGH